MKWTLVDRKPFVGLLLSTFVFLACNPSTTEERVKTTHQATVTSSAPVTLSLDLNQFPKLESLPMKFDEDFPTGNCQEIQKELLFPATYSIAIWDPLDVTEEQIPSDLLFETADLYVCMVIPMPDRKKGIIVRSIDEASALRNELYLILLDAQGKPTSGLVLTYSLETPDYFHELTSVLLPNYRVQVTQHSQPKFQEAGNAYRKSKLFEINLQEGVIKPVSSK